jgi:cytochrome c-type biogenesis protein CcmE
MKSSQAPTSAMDPTQPEDSRCPECGRFVGPLNRCPHCGTRIKKRMTVRFFRGMALTIGFAGLALLYLMVTRGEVPIIKVDNIDRTMNFAFVRVSGTVMGDSRIVREAGQVASVAFTLDDGSEEELVIRAYRAKARELIGRDLLPLSGDRVTVAGSLQVAADDMALWLADPDWLEIERAEITDLQVRQLRMDLEGRNVFVEGVITDVITPKVGTRMPWTVRFTDGTGDGRLNYWDDVYQELPDKLAVKPGATFRAQATVVYQQERLQFQMNRARQLTLLEDDAATIMAARPQDVPELLTPSELKRSQAGLFVALRGTLEQRSFPPEGSRAYHRFELGDGTATIEVVYQDVSARNLPQDAFPPGREVTVYGLVEELTAGPRIRIFHPSQLQESDG